MADVWTAPSGPAAGVSSRAEMISQRTDNVDVLSRAIDGDVSASTIKHRHKSGTFAALPAAGKAGRLYRATDTEQVFWDDGSDWLQVGGVWPHDSFDRANSSSLGTSNSGHAWTEEAGDWAINSNVLKLVTPSGINSVASLSLGGLAEMHRKVSCLLTTHGIPASIDVGVIIRYLDQDNYLFAEIVNGAGALHIVRRTSAGFTSLANRGFSIAVATGYVLEIEQYGPIVVARVRNSQSGASLAHIDYSTAADTVTPFVGATKVGFRIVNASGDQIHTFWVEGH